MSDATSTPVSHFIVKHLGKYYLTQDHWEFDPSLAEDNSKNSKLDENQKRSLKEVQALYEQGAEKAHGAVHVKHVQVSQFTEIGDGH